MKIRNGFVSNSSSSSFVIVGFDGEGVDISEEELKKRNLLWKYSRDKEFSLIGSLVCTGEEYFSEFDISSFEKKYKEAKEEIGKAIKDLEIGVKEHIYPQLKLYVLERNYYEFGLAQDIEERK